MSKLKLSGKELRAIGFPEGPVISIAMDVMQKNYKHNTKEEALDIRKKVVAAPEEYKDDAILGSIAKQLIQKPESLEGSTFGVDLKETGIPFNIFGREYIEEGAMHQMYTAA